MAPFYATAKHGVVGLVRSLAKPLGLEGIQINALAPSVVETNIASSGDLFKHMVITPMSTVTRAAETLLTDSSLTGKIAEVYEGNVTFAEQPVYADENVRKNIEMFWNLGYA
jgi:NAD(P)-dependent dehydrogenase (short-subunit alcohol dehydrogenase family)